MSKYTKSFKSAVLRALRYTVAFNRASLHTHSATRRLSINPHVHLLVSGLLLNQNGQECGRGCEDRQVFNLCKWCTGSQCWTSLRNLTGGQNPLLTYSDIRQYASQTSNCLKVRELLTGRYRGQLSLPYDLCCASRPKVILPSLFLKKKINSALLTEAMSWLPQKEYQCRIILLDSTIEIYSSRQKYKISLRPSFTILTFQLSPSFHCLPLTVLLQIPSVHAFLMELE